MFYNLLVRNDRDAFMIVFKCCYFSELMQIMQPTYTVVQWSDFHPPMFRISSNLN
jgi:hypothetical protein